MFPTEWVIAAVVAVISTLSGAVGVMWGRNNALIDARLADKDKEIQRWIDLSAELRRESPLDREAVNALSQQLQQLRETVIMQARGRR